LFHKLNKHTGNYRKHAQYLKEYFEYYLNKGEDKKAIVLKLQGFGYSADGKIRVNAPEGKELMVGYIHEDGTYHWF
jgi:hypothetical protein